MCEVQRLGHPRADADRPLGSERAAAEEHLEVLAFDVAHRDEQLVAGFAGGVDRDDVRVVERCSELGLLQEPLAERLILRQRRRQHLQRHLSLQAQILGEIHDAHATAPEHTHDPVPEQLSARRRTGRVHHGLATSRWTIGRPPSTD